MWRPRLRVETSPAPTLIVAGVAVRGRGEVASLSDRACPGRQLSIVSCARPRSTPLVLHGAAGAAKVGVEFHRPGSLSAPDGLDHDEAAVAVGTSLGSRPP